VPAQARSTADLIQAVITEEAPRPSVMVSAAPARRRALEGDLDNIIGKALKKEPAERYRSVGALADDLRRYLEHEPVQARPDTVSYRITKFVRRNRGSVVSGLLIALGLIATSIFALIQMQAARAQRDRAFQEAKRASAQKDLTQYILDDKLSKLSTDAERGRLERAREFVATRFRDDPVLAARLLLDLSGRYIDIGEYRRGAEVMVEAEAVARRFDDPDLLGQIACSRAEDLSIAQDFAGARRLLAAGLAQMQRLDPVSLGVEAECASAETFVAEADGDFERAVVRMRRTVADLERAGMRGAARYIVATNDLSRALENAGRYGESYRVSDANVKLVSEIGRADTGAYLIYVSHPCFALEEGGQPEHALAYLQAHTARLPHSPDYSDMPPGIQECWALSTLRMGAAGAEPAILAALDRAERGGWLDIGWLRSWSVKAALLRGDLATAEARWAPLAAEEQRLAATEKGSMLTDLLLLDARMNIARQHPDGALVTLRRLEKLVAARGQPTNPEQTEMEALLSSALLAKGLYPDAAHHAQKAVDSAERAAVDPASSDWVGQSLLLLARAQSAQGAKEVAVRTARQASTQFAGNVEPDHPLIAEARALAERFDEEARTR
jgi:hypothetical protein